MRSGARRPSPTTPRWCGLQQSIYTACMAVMIEIHNTGAMPAVRSEIEAIIEHALADRPGDWRVLIIGSQANDRWEMKITGPNAFERSYALEGSSGEHEPQVIWKIVAKMVSATRP